MKNTPDISAHLPVIDNKILELKALCDANISKTDLLKIINASNIKYLLKKNMIYSLLSERLDVAVQKKILNKNHGFEPKVLHQYTIVALNGAEKDDNIRVLSETSSLACNLRVLIYLNDSKLFNQEIIPRSLKKNIFYPEKKIIEELAKYFQHILFKEQDENWLNSLSDDIQYYVVGAKIYNILHSSHLDRDEFKIIMSLIERNADKWQIHSEYVSELFLELYFLTAKFDRIKLLVNNFNKNEVKYHAILGVVAFIEKDTKQAIILFDCAIKLAKSLSKRRNVCLPGIYGICHILALLKEQSPIEQIQNLTQQHKSLISAFQNELKQYNIWHYSQEAPEFPIWRYFNSDHEISFLMFENLVTFTKFGLNNHEKESFASVYRALKPLDCFISLLTLWWLEINWSSLVNICDKAYQGYYVFLTIFLVIEDIRLKMNASNQTDQDHKDHQDHDNQIITNQSSNLDFTNIIAMKPKWERSMEVLEELLTKQGTNGLNKNSSDKRLVWMLYPKRNYDKIIPFEQKRQNNGLWNKGRSAALKRLCDTTIIPEYLSYQDKQVIKAAERSYYYNSYSLNEDKALIALVDHPLVFDGETGEHLELIKTSPELIVKEENDAYQISLSEYAVSPSVKLKQESKNKYQVIDISGPMLDAMKIVGDGINVPRSAKERLLSFVKKAASNLNIRTELNEEDLVGEPGDATIIVQLSYDHGLKVKLCTRPFGEEWPYYSPGLGNKSIFTKLQKPPYHINNKNNNTNANTTNNEGHQAKLIIRDLVQEKDNATHLIGSCPTLKQQQQEEECSNYDWDIDDLEQALELLYALNDYKNQYKQNRPEDQNHGQDLGYSQKLDQEQDQDRNQGHNHQKNIIIQWPYGQSLFINREISFKNMKLNIKSDNQWFDLAGEVELEEDQVLEMQHFLSKLEQAKGRFIPLGDNKFIALTKEFLNKIQQLKTIAKIDDQNVAIHKLASPLLNDFTNQVASFKADKAWKIHIDKISASEKYEPQVPKNLKAELRPYQLDGYKWLSRLAYLGFGACLADDMGLGKTVQTIALLLEQAVLGPCLVIAPASVCYVWEDECKKFAPDLNCKVINQENRTEQIENLSKMDVLVCSYAILYQIEELITEKNWQVVVLDEAQAIKNYNTKRFKIALQFRAQHRLALSGTPVENHVEELWNLFEFLNPGLLGSRKMFQEKYTKPIQENNSQVARDALRNVISPFILRRLKNKVLDELPAKTETTIFIEPSEKETSFYEALRRESLEIISALTEASAAKKRFSVLAEITKLRRACCDASLVSSVIEQNNIPNSKLIALDEIIKELKENNHRALIFSQYVDYLQLVKLRLDKNNIRYQYLDGSVPQKQRRERVKAFQEGEGDLFLISLKAGGVGLNLTSADYVIHLDPWWNPAVEDQASDRAHRIGQKRAVTVYRLVMKHSIEEKIIKMHHDKRDLAISLLTDADKSANLTESDLLKLISF